MEYQKSENNSELNQKGEDLCEATERLSVCDVAEETMKTEQISLLSYGLGRVSSCPIAQHQLAFFLALRGKLNNPPTHVYDPLFSDEEIVALEQFGCCVLNQNEEGKRVCQSPTIAFLPHCGKALYNNLLWANLALSQHQGIYNLLLVGNSFSLQNERVPSRVLKKTGNYILKMLPYTLEKPLTLTFKEDDIFNDLSIHTFPRLRLSEASVEFWDDLKEPQYEKDEAEIIRNKTSTNGT